MSNSKMNLVLSAVVGLAMLCIPVLSQAGEVPWTTTYYQSDSQVIRYQYTNDNQIELYNQYDNHFDSKPGNTHFEYKTPQGGYSRAKCEYSYKRIKVSAAALEREDNAEIYGYAVGGFLGEYIGTDEPLVFKYSLVTQKLPFNFMVVDYTTGDTLYDRLLTSGDGIISVSVPVGHIISVSYQLEAQANSIHNVQPPWTVFGQEGVVVDQAKLDYSLRLGGEDSTNEDF